MPGILTDIIFLSGNHCMNPRILKGVKGLQSPYGPLQFRVCHGIKPDSFRIFGYKLQRYLLYRHIIYFIFRKTTKMDGMKEKLATAQSFI